jgi:Glycosyltransferase family 87
MIEIRLLPYEKRSKNWRLESLSELAGYLATIVPVRGQAKILRSLRLSKLLVIFFAITIGVIAFLPINNYFRGDTNDYAKWFRVEQAVLQGGDIYAPRGDGTFQFMYPPTAAVLFAIPSYFGELPLIVFLVILYSVAWIASLLLSVFLVTGAVWRNDPLLYFVPGVCCLPYVVENYLLGQPNLLLLALMLAAFVCLRSGKAWSTGALVALASAIKAFPVLAICLFCIPKTLESDPFDPGVSHLVSGASPFPVSRL